MISVGQVEKGGIKKNICNKKKIYIFFSMECTNDNMLNGGICYLCNTREVYLLLDQTCQRALWENQALEGNQSK